jgi:hypothetical protein
MEQVEQEVGEIPSSPSFITQEQAGEIFMKSEHFVRCRNYVFPCCLSAVLWTILNKIRFAELFLHSKIVEAVIVFFLNPLLRHVLMRVHIFRHP